MKKIAILSTSLKNGGAERFVLNLRDLLLNLGYQVEVVLVSDVIDFQLDFKCISLENTFTRKAKFLKPYYLRQYLIKHKIDVLIDNRTISSFSKSVVYHFFTSKFTTVKMIHNFNVYSYLFKSVFKNDLLFNKTDRIVCVSKEIENKVCKLLTNKNVTTIYNSAPKISFLKEPIKENYILFYGRLEEKSKNISFIINSYKKSVLPGKQIKLYILGSGADAEKYKSMVADLDLQNEVVFLNQTENPFGIVANALFTVMASNYEGFPMTMVESLYLGIPVLTTNFKSGPSEIIQNRKNGIIVNANLQDFIEAMNLLATDTLLYAYCKENAKGSIVHLYPENIQKKWQNLIETI